MSAIEDLTEVAQRATAADTLARSSKWMDRDALQRKVSELDRTLAEASTLLDRPPLGPRQPSPIWEQRARALLAGPSPTGAPAQADPDAAAGIAEADAAAAVDVARIALTMAHRAALLARMAAIDAGDTASTDAAVRGLRQVAGANPVAAHSFEVGRDVREELRHIVHDRPRDIALRISISLGFGLAYLAILRFLFWRQTVEHEFPYLALYAFSGIAGSMVCTNALCVDANRVRTKLLSGERLWHILVAKNLAVGIIVGGLGLAMNLLLAIFWTRDWSMFLKANGMFLTMLLLWFGVGNVLSILAPLKDEPLIRRPRDGTLVRYLISFAISYGLSYAVNLMLYWRVWAKQTLLERFSGPWIPVLLVVGSALLSYVLFTVLALSLAQQSPRRRALSREMVDYRTGAG